MHHIMNTSILSLLVTPGWIPGGNWGTHINTRGEKLWRCTAGVCYCGYSVILGTCQNIVRHSCNMLQYVAMMCPAMLWKGPAKVHENCPAEWLISSNPGKEPCSGFWHLWYIYHMCFVGTQATEFLAPRCRLLSVCWTSWHRVSMFTSKLMHLKLPAYIHRT